MTNPALQGMVKIGYATNVEQRRKQLSTTALPYEYEVYATYETSGNLEDKKLHRMIDNLNSDLRVSKSREFFIMSAEDAYELLESIATISGTKDKLKKVKCNPCAKQIVKKPPIDFYQCGLKDGDELIYVEDDSVVVLVQGPHKVLWGEELTSLSAVVKSIKNPKGSFQGPQFFTYKGEPILDIANRTQWKEYNK